MKLELAAIKFRHDANVVGARALKIRRNAFINVPVPEWRHGISQLPEHSPAAYAIRQVGNIPVTIQASFRASQPFVAPLHIQVRAVHPVIPEFILPWQVLMNTQVNVLGEVKARSVVIDQDGATGFLTFELKDHRLLQSGVGIHKVVWNWQYKLPGSSFWTDFAITRHKIYTLLNVPTEPWIQTDRDDVCLPWTEVMDHACAWAFNATTEDAAATAITRKLFYSVPPMFEYNCINFMPAYVQIINFAGDSFLNCTALLEHLRTGNVNRYIICSDCAAIVSTFANILGCDLWQSAMLTLGTMFRVNRILPIGARFWQIPCGSPGFSFHEVAWEGNCTSAEPIYDACLAIDGTPNPLDGVSWPLLPTNMFLGFNGSGLYRDKLVFPLDWNLCQPNPMFRQRRLPALVLRVPHAAVAMAKEKSVEEDKKTVVKEHYNFKAWQNYSNLGENLFVKDFFLDHDAFPQWHIQVLDEVKRTSNAPGFIHSIWRPSQYASSSVRVDVYECPSRVTAQEFALQLLANTHTTLAKKQEPPIAGDVAFTWLNEKSILFTRANLVFMIANAAKPFVPVIPFAVSIDRYLSSKPAEPLDDSTIVTVKKRSGSGKAKTKARFDLVFHSPKAPSSNLRTHNLERTSTDEPRVFYKIFASEGEFTEDSDSLLYQPPDSRKQKIIAYVVSNGQRIRTQSIKL